MDSSSPKIYSGHVNSQNKDTTINKRFSEIEIHEKKSTSVTSLKIRLLHLYKDYWTKDGQY